ncbi:MAG: hypothetical protein ABSB84_07215 [Verrucomicrobiota bacterium]
MRYGLCRSAAGREIPQAFPALLSRNSRAAITHLVVTISRFIFWKILEAFLSKTFQATRLSHQHGEHREGVGTD